MMCRIPSALSRAAVVCGLGLVTVTADAAFVGPAQEYSVFLLGDVRYGYSDTQTSMYVGGNADLDHFRVGADDQLARGRAANLAVRGNTRLTDSSVDGNLMHGGNVELTRASVGGQTTGGDFSGFDSAPTFYRSLSGQWASQSGSSFTTTPWGEVTLVAGSGENYFNLSRQDLPLFNRLNINLQPDSLVTLNLLGDGWMLHDLGFYLNGELVDQMDDPGAHWANNVILNFPDATSLQLGGPGGLGLPASLMAPNAEIFAINGQMFGDLVAGSLSDSNQPLTAGRFQFNNVDPVPLPGSFLLLVSGLLTLRRRLLR